MPLFQVKEKAVTRLKPEAFLNERQLQRLFEANLEELLGVRFVVSEFSTGERHGGRIDTLGIDENDCPVIIEYKLSSKSNIINQGLYYLDWLLDHKGDFQIAVQEYLGSDVTVSWDYTRLVLIARDFNRYDRYAVEQIGRLVELKSYRLYQNGLLYLEDVYSTPLPQITKVTQTEALDEADKKAAAAYSVDVHLEDKPAGIQDIFAALREYILSLGGDVIEKPTKLYIAYSASRNFCEIELQKSQLKLALDIPYDELSETKLVRDASKIGHWPTGSCQVIIKPANELEPVYGLIRESYEYFQ